MLAAHRSFGLGQCRRKAAPRAVNYYHDRVDASDHSNRECFVYSLGCYGNRPIYCVGETNDLHATEFVLKRTFPVYTKVRSVPAEDAKRLKYSISTRVVSGDATALQPTAFLAPALAKGLSGVDWMFLEANEDVFNLEEVSKKMS